MIQELVNESGLSPRGRAVLVRPYAAEKMSSILAIPDSVQSSLEMLEQRAVVIEVGPMAWHDEKEPRAKVGDRVLVTRFAGFNAQGVTDGKQYRLINDRDIFAVIKQEL